MMNADEKLLMLLDKGVLLAPDVFHEVLVLFSTLASDIQPETRRQVLEAIDTGPPGVSDPVRADAIRQRLLLALRESGVEIDEMGERLQRIEERHPQLARERQPAEAPSEAEQEIGLRSPSSVDDLLEKSPSDPSFLEWLLSYDEHGWKESREGLLDTLGIATRRSFDWAMTLAESLGSRGAWGSDVIGTLLSGWSERALSTDEWWTLLEFLGDVPDKGSQCFRIADLLEGGMRKPEGSRIPYSLVPRAEAVADATWRACRERSDAEGDEEREWLAASINRTPGKLALFFVTALSERRTVDALDHLPEEVRGVFDQMLAQETLNDRLGAVVLASQAHFLHSLDPSWARDALLPAFDWARDPEAAHRAWHGFLTWGRLPPPLIEDMMPLYLGTMSHLTRFTDLRHRFAEHLSVIALREQQPSVGRAWIDDLITRAEPEDVTYFTRAVSFDLRDFPEDIRVRAWDEWLRGHWERRLEGLPRQMGDGEAREIVAWAVLIPERFADAVSLLSQGRSAGAYDLCFSDLEKRSLADNYPRLTAELLRHVLIGQDRTFYHCSEARELADALTQSDEVDDSTQRVIREHLLRLGCE